MQLPDPTDYGNAPGLGPLRVGGVPGTVSKTEDKDLPSTPSPAAKRQAPALKIVRDLSGGTETVRAAGREYLPQAPGEESDEYNNRLMRSVFYNAFGRTVEALTGLVMRRDPVLSEDVPAQIVEHWENIDNCGTHGDVFVRDLLKDDIEAGHSAILVEYPRVDEESVEDGTQARLEADGKLRPYWVPIRKDDILSWWVTTEDGASVLEQVVIRCREMVKTGMFTQAAKTQYRVIQRMPPGTDSDGKPLPNVTWKLLEITENDEVMEVDAGEYRNQDEIPLALVTSSGHVDTLESRPPLLDLAYLNIAHYQQQSDYFFAIHKTNVPFLFGAGLPTHDNEGNKIQLVVGPNTAITASDPNAKLEYVAHDGASLGATKGALDDLKAEMGTLGLEFLTPQQQRQQDTATGRRMDKAAGESPLATTARRLQDGIERALYFHARYMKLESGGSVTINRDFEGLMMEAPVMSAFAQLVQAGFPPGPVLKALQTGGRISDDEDLDSLELLWLAGLQAKEVAQQLEEEDGLEMDDAA